MSKIDRITPRVVLYEAVYGIPAEVMVREDGAVRVSHFSVGHVFTDNANARAFANEAAKRLGCSVEREA